MVNHQKEITVKRVNWSACVARGLKRAACGDLKEIEAQVKSGAAWVWEFVGLGYLVARVDTFENSKEFVIVAGEGKGFDVVAPFLIDAAKRLECDAIRTHTQSKAIARMWSRYGLTINEYVLKKAL